MRTTIVLAGMLLLCALTAGCKTERQKMVSEWEQKICSSKDHDEAFKELMKYEKWIDEKGWSDADTAFRHEAFDRAHTCFEKIKQD
jgi:hypothetical protein